MKGGPREGSGSYCQGEDWLRQGAGVTLPLTAQGSVFAKELATTPRQPLDTRGAGNSASQPRGGGQGKPPELLCLLPGGPGRRLAGGPAGVQQSLAPCSAGKG